MLKKIIILKKQSHILTVGLFWGLLCLVSLDVLAQSPHIDSLKIQPKDSVAFEIIKEDSLLIKADTLAKGMDSLQIKNEKGDIETTIYYHAEDSIMMDVLNKKAYLYGKAQIKYQDMQIDAEQVEIQWEKNIITARGRVDSTGKYIGYPVWKQGTDTYVTDTIQYNMKSQKGIIHGIVTKQGEGYLHGDTAKRTPDAIFLKNGRYTTCDLKHPHFYIKARKLKVMPDDKAVCGPFNMVIEDIETPIGFWMGFFPITDKEKSGIIFPSFGENQNRGFSLSRGGYYWAVNDYLGIKLEGDVFANGSYKVDLSSTYLKRYQYKGSTMLSIGQYKDGFDEGTTVQNIFQANWQHSTTAKRNGTFTSTVNLTSSKYQKSVNYTPSRNNNNSTSQISYSRVFGRTPFSANISMRASQNVSGVTSTNNASSQYDLTLPSASLTMARINPFKRKYGDGNKFYEKIFLNYQGNFAYDLSNKQRVYNPTLGFSQDSILQVNESNLNNYILPNSKWSSLHSASVSSVFKIFKQLNVTPSINNFFNLYGKKLSYDYNTTTKKLSTIDTTNGLYSVYYMNASLEVNTRMYGTLQFKNNGLIKGIRHTFNPSVSFTYAPDFSRSSTGGYNRFEGYEAKGKQIPVTKYIGNSTPTYKREEINFTLNNILEAKVRNRKDTTGTNKYKKTNLLDNVSMAGGYNFGIDSLKMKNISVVARTKLFGIFDITLNSLFDPYAHVYDSLKYINGKKYLFGERQINVYNVNYTGERGGSIAQLNNLNFTVSARFAPKKKTPKKDPSFNNTQMQAELDYIRANPDQYLDFNIPWSLALSFTNNYKHDGLNDPVISQAITANGDISLSAKWKISYNTGYNFKDKSITTSNFTIYRDLHCWQMNMLLSPFGSYRTFMFTISAKSTMLQQLKLNKRAPTFIQ